MRDELVALAEHDAASVRARHDLEHPPSGAELAAIDEERAVLRREKLELDAVRAPLLERAGELERDAAAARERAGVVNARLRDATGAGRELEAMAKEADSLAARALGDDDALYGLLEELEPLDEHDADLRRRFEDATARHDDALARVTEERNAARAALEELDAGRGALLERLDEQLRARYEYAARRAGGVGAAVLEDGRCGGCRVAVPAAVADHLLRGHNAELVVVCDECGRLLVH